MKFAILIAALGTLILAAPFDPNLKSSEANNKNPAPVKRQKNALGNLIGIPGPYTEFCTPCGNGFVERAWPPCCISQRDLRNAPPAAPQDQAGDEKVTSAAGASDSNDGVITENPTPIEREDAVPVPDHAVDAPAALYTDLCTPCGNGYQVDAWPPCCTKGKGTPLPAPRDVLPQPHVKVGAVPGASYRT